MPRLPGITLAVCLVAGLACEPAGAAGKTPSEFPSGAPCAAFGPHSRGRTYGERAVLDRGQAEVRGPCRLEAHTLQVAPEPARAVARVALASPGRVQIAALAGSVVVRNSVGAIVANIRPGAALAFEPLPDSGRVFAVTGKLILESGTYLLTDATTGVKLELVGGNLDRFVGRDVVVRGTGMAGAGPVPKVAVEPGGIQLAEGQPAAATVATGRTLAIVSGVAVGGTVAALAGAGVFSSGRGQPISSY